MPGETAITNTARQKTWRRPPPTKCQLLVSSQGLSPLLRDGSLLFSIFVDVDFRKAPSSTLGKRSNNRRHVEGGPSLRDRNQARRAFFADDVFADGVGVRVPMGPGVRMPRRSSFRPGSPGKRRYDARKTVEREPLPQTYFRKEEKARRANYQCAAIRGLTYRVVFGSLQSRNT